MPQTDTPSSTKDDFNVRFAGSASAIRASEKMYNYNLQAVDYDLSIELKINRIRSL